VSPAVSEKRTNERRPEVVHNYAVGGSAAVGVRTALNACDPDVRGDPALVYRTSSLAEYLEVDIVNPPKGVTGYIVAALFRRTLTVDRNLERFT